MRDPHIAELFNPLPAGLDLSGLGTLLFESFCAVSFLMAMVLRSLYTVRASITNAIYGY